MYAEFTDFGLTEESVYGTHPAADRQLLLLQDLRPGRNRAEEEPNVWSGTHRSFPLELTDGSGSLTLPSLLTYENFLMLEEGLMGNDRAAAVSETGTDVSCASGVLTSTAMVDTTGFLANDMIEISGAGIAPNLPEFYGPLVSKTATTLTFPTGQLVDFTAGGSVTLRTRRLLDANVEHSFSYIAQALKGTNQFLGAEGNKLSGIRWAWQYPGFATQEATLEGREYTWRTSASPSTGTIAKLAPVFMGARRGAGASGGVGRMWLTLGTAAMPAATSLVITNWGIDWKRKIDQVKGLGVDGAAAIEEGSISGSMISARVRWDDAARTAVADPIDGRVALTAAISVRDRTGNRMCFLQPCGIPRGTIEFGAKGSVMHHPLEIVSADAALTPTSHYYTAGAGIGFQHAIYYVPGV